MILARLTRAIRAQNWFAVVLEFVIVIAGVVIGFQVTAWNESRIERAREDALLERLHEDFTQLREAGDTYLANTARQRALLQVWIEARDAGGGLDVDALRLLTLGFYRQDHPERMDGLANASSNLLLFEAISGGLTPRPSITFQQLVASGDLRLLRSPELRAALGRHESRRAEAVYGIQSNDGASVSVMRNEALAAIWNVAAPGGETAIAAVIPGPAFTEWLRTMYALNEYNDSWYRAAHGEILPVIALLEQEMGLLNEAADEPQSVPSGAMEVGGLNDNVGSPALPVETP